MIHRERVADDVYVFQSDVYADVNAGAVVGPEWAVVIDTLPYPNETLAIRTFIEKELNRQVRYVINTHYHADHSWGTCFFPGALVIAHEKCRELLKKEAVPALELAREQDPVFKHSQIVLPHLTLNSGEITLKVDSKTLRIFELPGHTPDGLGLYIPEAEVLFAGDVWMPIPHILDGDPLTMRQSLRKLHDLTLENVVQGHGAVILRGEVTDGINDRIKYLDYIEEIVGQAAQEDFPGEYLEKQTVEKFGKNRVLLGGAIEEVHQQNLRHAYMQKFGEDPWEYEEEMYY
ncbi:MAG: Metallo-beta-lactamase type 2 [Chloroflexi bacterium]|nr:Metallo-beta-lactamase type 2 [Chloroflexota bacterium]